MKNKVFVYRDQLLPASNTFVRKQAEYLNTFEPVFFGSKEENQFKSSGLEVHMPDHRIHLFNKYEETLFKLFEIIPLYAKKYKANSGGFEQCLMHAHFGPDGLLALPIATYFEIPILVTFHGYEVTIDEHLLKSYSLRDRKFVRNKLKLNKKATKFIAVSNFLKQKMIERGFDQKKIVQHYIGVDVDFFSPSWKPSASKKILFVGRLVEKKGCTYLLKSVALLKSRIHGLELEIIGDGPLRGELELEAKNLSLPCQFLGIRDSHFIKERLSQSSVFCVPSIIAENGDAESFGIVFAEAQAMGVPVVSFNSAGIPEVVEHGINGFLAQEKNIEELAEYLDQLLSDDHLASRFSKAGIENIKSRFDLKKQTQKLESIYHEVVS